MFKFGGVRNDEKGGSWQCVMVVGAMVITHVSSQQNAPGYLGCFVDVTSDRALTPGLLVANTQSVERCFKYCLDEQGETTNLQVYKYAGLEYYDECFCGNNENYGRHGRTPDNQCRDRCDGNRDQICGDGNRLSMYKISQGVCSNDIGPPTDGSHIITNPRSLSYNLNNFKFFGTRVDFHCDDGYTLIGASSIECIDTGYNNVTWSDRVPVCEDMRSTTVPTTTFPATTFSSGESFTFVESSAEPLTTATPPSSVDDPPASTKLATGAIVGIAVGGTSLILILLLIILILWRKRKPKDTKSSQGNNYQNDTYELTDNVYQKTLESSQTVAAAYSLHVIPDKATSDDVYAVVDDDTNTSQDMKAAQPTVSHSDSPSVLDKTEWTENTLYGRALFPPVSADSTGNEYDDQTNQDIMQKRTSGWEENIIYE